MRTKINYFLRHSFWFYFHQNNNWIRIIGLRKLILFIFFWEFIKGWKNSDFVCRRKFWRIVNVMSNFIIFLKCWNWIIILKSTVFGRIRLLNLWGKITIISNLILKTEALKILASCTVAYIMPVWNMKQLRTWVGNFKGIKVIIT